MATKYGKNQDRDTKRQHRRAIEEATAVVPWSPDPSRPTETSTETLQTTSTRRLSQRTVKYQGENRLVEFAVVVTLNDGVTAEREILCIDTCNHGTVHRHRDGDHRSREDIRVIDSQDVIQDCFWDALEEAMVVAYEGDQGA